MLYNPDEAFLTNNLVESNLFDTINNVLYVGALDKQLSEITLINQETALFNKQNLTWGELTAVHADGTHERYLYIVSDLQIGLPDV
jgi:hypothetical protein